MCDVEGCANAGNHCGEHSLAPQFSNGTSSTGTSTSISAPLCYVKTIPFGNPIERKGERKVANAEEIQLTTSQHEFMTDSMTVNVDEQSDFDLNISQDYQEVLEELGNQEGWDALTAQLRQMAEGKGTTWRAFSGSKKSLTAGGHVYAFGRKSLETIPSVPDTPRAPDELLNETGEVPRDTQPVYSSCDASGEMSNEEDAERSYEGRLMEPQSKMELPVTDATTPVSRNGSLKRRRRRRMERPLSLSGQRILTSLLNAEPLMTASFHEGRQAGHSVFHSDYSNSRRLLDGSGDIWDYSNSHRMSRSMNTSSSATGSHVWGAEGLATPTPSLDNVLLTSSGYGEDFPAIQSENCSPVRHSRMTSSVTLPAGLKYVCEGSPKHLLE